MELLSQVLPSVVESSSDLGAVIAMNLPWIVMLVLGLALVIVEMYIPGFGVPGILGGILLVAGVLLCSRGDLVMCLILVVIIVALLCVALSISIRSASRGRLSRSKLVLKEVSVNEVGENDLSYYVGHDGEAKTVLRPAGIAEFDGVRLNVVSDGEFINEGDRVKVARVEGNRIVVVKT